MVLGFSPKCEWQLKIPKFQSEKRTHNAKMNVTLKHQNKEPHSTFICPNDLMRRRINGATMHIKISAFVYTHKHK